MLCIIYVLYIGLLYKILIKTRVLLFWPFENHSCIPLQIIPTVQSLLF